MYSTCLFCHADLGTNEIVEAFPIGRRLAFDSAKGRLWVVCRKCEKWNLTPFDERWEAVEDCERRFRDAKKRVASDNIGLARLDEGLELVRIGEPMRPEFAAWRYGDQFGRRRRRALVIGAGAVAVGGAVVWGGIATGVLGGATWQIWQAVQYGIRAVRNRRIVARVPTQGTDVLTVRGKHIAKAKVRLSPSGEDGWNLELPHEHGRVVLEGANAVHVTSLIMPAINRSGASKNKVKEAVQRIERWGTPEAYLVAAAKHYSGPVGRHKKHPGAIQHFSIQTRLAIEMAVNEENEREALEGELTLLESAWRDAEEIAAIADSLVPGQIDEQFEKLRGANMRRTTP